MKQLSQKADRIIKQIGYSDRVKHLVRKNMIDFLSYKYCTDVDSIYQDYLKSDFREWYYNTIHEIYRNLGTATVTNKFDLETLYLIIRASRPKIVVETGVFYGSSTVFILQALKENGYGGFLYSIDKEVNPLVLNGYPHKQNWKMVVGDSTIRLPRLLRDIKTINHFHHDSLHTYNNMMFEYKTALRQLSHNGVITSHDVLLSPITRNPFRDLCKTHGLGK